jgi:hypothetical protein
MQTLFQDVEYPERLLGDAEMGAITEDALPVIPEGVDGPPQVRRNDAIFFRNADRDPIRGTRSRALGVDPASEVRFARDEPSTKGRLTRSSNRSRRHFRRHKTFVQPRSTERMLSRRRGSGAKRTRDRLAAVRCSTAGSSTSSLQPKRGPAPAHGRRARTTTSSPSGVDTRADNVRRTGRREPETNPIGRGQAASALDSYRSASTSDPSLCACAFFLVRSLRVGGAERRLVTLARGYVAGAATSRWRSSTRAARRRSPAMAFRSMIRKARQVDTQDSWRASRALRRSAQTFSQRGGEPLQRRSPSPA